MSKGYARADEIIEEVCEEYGVTEFEIIGMCRRKTIAAARKEAIQRIADQTCLSIPEIGQRFDRDNATIHVAINGRKS